MRARPRPPPWYRIPAVLLEEFLSYLPFDAFATDHWFPGLVCKAWRVAARRSPIIARIRNTRLLGRLCRVPGVIAIDADWLDETLVEALSPLRNLRSLRWRSHDAPAFDALPAILERNARLAVVVGSHGHFNGLVPGVGQIARRCEKILVDRPGATVNGHHVFTCQCGDQRFTKLICSRYDCPQFKPRAFVMMEVKDTATDIAGLTGLRQDLKQRNPTSLEVTWLVGMAGRFLQRLAELSSTLELKDKAVAAERSELATARFTIRQLQCARIEATGALAGALADTEDLRNALAAAKMENKVLREELENTVQTRMLEASLAEPASPAVLAADLRAAKSSCKFLEQERRAAEARCLRLRLKVEEMTARLGPC